MANLREALEAALVEDPDDLAAHMAYADHLVDQGDPRGELIQVQLALEDADLAGHDRSRLAERERQLLAELRAALLGGRLAGNRNDRFEIRRGWLAEVAVEWLDEGLALDLATAPQARLVRRFALLYPQYAEHFEPGEPTPVAILARSDNLRTLRVLALGTSPGFDPDEGGPVSYHSRGDLYQAGPLIWDWVARLPRLEELYLACLTTETERLFGLDTLTRLRILQVYLSTDYPLVTLGRNPALGNLTHLSFHPAAARPDDGEEAFLSVEHLAAIARSPHLRKLTHLRFQRSDAGDLGVRVLIESGLLRRLTFLDLAMGEVTDAGAALLAEADLGRLEHLDLSDNALTPEGQRRLGLALGKKLRLCMDRQHAEDAQGWLTDGEME